MLIFRLRVSSRMTVCVFCATRNPVRMQWTLPVVQPESHKPLPWNSLPCGPQIFSHSHFLSYRFRPDLPSDSRYCADGWNYCLLNVCVLQPTSSSSLISARRFSMTCSSVHRLKILRASQRSDWLLNLVIFLTSTVQQGVEVSVFTCCNNILRKSSYLYQKLAVIPTGATWLTKWNIWNQYFFFRSGNLFQSVV